MSQIEHVDASDDEHSPSPLLTAALNLSHFHRAHEKFYASSPVELAVRLQRHARTLQALADRWSHVEPSTATALSPYAGAEDLNDDAALQLDGVLFMEDDREPAEITQLVRDLRTTANDLMTTGEWLAEAMQASWDVAASLVEMDELAGVLGDRHRIIANDWQAACMSSLAGRLLVRSAELLERIDFAASAIRRDLQGARVVPARLYSATELIGAAADVCSASAALVHDNEPRWRRFRGRVDEVVGA